MNYNKIHDAIIDRARERVRDSSLYQNHHIIPLHEDKTSTETVPLTIKEHYVVHHLRWKMVGTPGNLYAYRLIKNGEQDPEAWVEFCREIGKKGAAAWLEQSTPAQRSDALKKGSTPAQRSERGKKGVAAWLEQSTPAQRSEAVKKGSTPAQRSERGKKGAATRLEQSTPAQRSERSKKAAATRLAKSTPEQRSERSKKAAATWLAKSTPAQRSEATRKGHATRKANKQLRGASLDI